MKRRLSWFDIVGPVVFWLSAAALAFGESVVLMVTDEMAFVIDTEAGTATKADRVIRLGGQAPPKDDLEALARTWRTKVADYSQKDFHRRALGGMYQLLSQRATDGSFKTLTDLQNTTSRMRDVLLANDRSKWDVWGRDIGEWLGERVSDLSSAQLAYRSIARGLEAGDLQRVDPSFWEFLIRILELILRLIGGGNGDA